MGHCKYNYTQTETQNKSVYISFKSGGLNNPERIEPPLLLSLRLEYNPDTISAYKGAGLAFDGHAHDTRTSKSWAEAIDKLLMVWY